MDAHRRISTTHISPTGLTCCAFVAHVALAASALAAAAPVQESEGREIRRDSQALPENDPAEPPSDVNTLYHDFQFVQDEVRRLHGVVEELNHRMDRLEREQRERYIELDQRLLDRGKTEGIVPEGGDVVPDPTSDAPPVPLTERDAYNVAIELVEAARPLPASEQRPQYQRAMGLFREIIKDYPNGEYTANAFYWRGQLHFALKEYEDARAMFTQVDLLYDDHPKVPDSLYKLGEVYDVLGDTERAREYLNRVINDFPASTAAGLARKYLAELR